MKDFDEYFAWVYAGGRKKSHRPRQATTIKQRGTD
jgi:hypothetical protein